MHEYRVVERWADKGLCALQCNSGRYHVARALHVMPPAQVPLCGDKPHLGFGILVCTQSGAVFRVIFEAVNETQLVPDPGRTLSSHANLKQASGAAPGRGD